MVLEVRRDQGPSDEEGTKDQDGLELRRCRCRRRRRRAPSKEKEKLRDYSHFTEVFYSPQMTRL